MNKEEICKNCVYCHTIKYVNDRVGFMANPYYYIYECHRHAPNTTVGVRSSSVTNVCWTKVQKNDWCGEWQYNKKLDEKNES